MRILSTFDFLLHSNKWCDCTFTFSHHVKVVSDTAPNHPTELDVSYPHLSVCISKLQLGRHCSLLLQLFCFFGTMLGCLQYRRPLLICIDTVHWGKKQSSLELYSTFSHPIGRTQRNRRTFYQTLQHVQIDCQPTKSFALIKQKCTIINTCTG